MQTLPQQKTTPPTTSSKREAVTILDPKTLGDARGEGVPEGMPPKGSAAQAPAATGLLSINAGDTVAGAVVESLLGSGAESDIFKVSKNGTPYVLKLYRPQVEPKQEVFSRLCALSVAISPYVVVTHEAAYLPDLKRWYELQEFVPGGTIHSCLQTPCPDTESFLQMARKLSAAIHAVHGQGIIHRDIKPSNILLRSAAPLDPVISDFGIASMIDPEIGLRVTRAKFTVLYAAPESVLPGVAYAGFAVDWWALGMILLEYHRGRHYFDGLDDATVLHMISTKEVELPPELSQPRGERHNRRLLLRGLLTRDPEKRWGFDEISRWLQGECDIPVAESVRDEKTELLFDGKRYSGLGDLVIAFCASPAAWQEGQDFFQFETLRLQIKERGDLEELYFFEKCQSDPDKGLGFFCFVHGANKELGFIYEGHPITLRNLHRWSLLAVPATGKSGAATPEAYAATQLYEKICSPRFALFEATYEKIAGALDPHVKAVLGFLRQGLNEPDRLNAVLFPEQYYWGESDTRNMADRIKFVFNAPLLIPVSRLRAGGKKIVLPRETVRNFSKPESYRMGLAFLEKVQTQQFIITDDMLAAEQEADAKESVLASEEGYFAYFRRSQLGRDSQTDTRLATVDEMLTRLNKYIEANGGNTTVAFEYLSFLQQDTASWFPGDAKFLEKLQTCLDRLLAQLQRDKAEWRAYRIMLWSVLGMVFSVYMFFFYGVMNEFNTLLLAVVNHPITFAVPTLAGAACLIFTSPDSKGFGGRRFALSAITLGVLCFLPWLGNKLGLPSIIQTIPLAFACTGLVFGFLYFSVLQRQQPSISLERLQDEVNSCLDSRFLLKRLES